MPWSMAIAAAHSVSELPEPFQVIDLMASGEPLNHPSFDHILELLGKELHHRNTFNIIRFNTSSPSLKNNIANIVKIASTGTSLSIGISMDAASEETFQKIKPGNNYNDLLEGAEALLEARKTHNLENWIFIDILYLVTPDNRHEAQTFLAQWRKKLSGIPHKIHFPNMQGPFGARTGICFHRARALQSDDQHLCDNAFINVISELPPFSSLKSEAVLPLPNGEVCKIVPPMNEDEILKLNLGMIPFPDSARPPCSAPLEGPWVVAPDGDLRICCHWSGTDGTIGNILSGLQSLQNSEKVHSEINSMLKGHFKNCCKNCISPQHTDFRGSWMPNSDLVSQRYNWWRHGMFSSAYSAFENAVSLGIPDPNIKKALKSLKKEENL